MEENREFRKGPTQIGPIVLDKDVKPVQQRKHSPFKNGIRAIGHARPKK